MDLTKLTPEEEVEFQNWIRQLAWYRSLAKEIGRPPDIDTPLYDYRAAWKAGVEPGPNMHWSSKFKSKYHPRAVIWQDGELYNTIYDEPFTGWRRDQR